MKRNYREFYALIKGKPYSKAEIVSSFTDGQTESLSAMSDQQFEGLMQFLRPKMNDYDFTPKPGDAQRKKMISIARQMNWGDQVQSSSSVVQAVNNWCLKQRYKKPLMQHNVQELNILVTIMEEKVYPSYLKGLNKG